jgi:negative regulator of replication initiation
MSPSDIVERLQNYVHACNTAASACEAEYVEAIREHAVTILSAADLIVQLQGRLVRQAMYFEQIEAVNEPRWPLLAEEEDDPGMSL